MRVCLVPRLPEARFWRHPSIGSRWPCSRRSHDPSRLPTDFSLLSAGFFSGSSPPSACVCLQSPPPRAGHHGASGGLHGHSARLRRAEPSECAKVPSVIALVLRERPRRAATWTCLEGVAGRLVKGKLHNRLASLIIPMDGFLFSCAPPPLLTSATGALDERQRKRALFCFCRANIAN